MKPWEWLRAKITGSLWKMEAYEERQWYGIDHRMAAMGILVNTRSANERANIVAFTGNPTAPDDRYLVNAQVGELDVVASEPGVTPEKVLLDVSTGDGTDIIRIAYSNETNGQWVLSDEQLRALGQTLAEIEANYPIDGDPPNDATVLFDTEWKVLSDGRLVIKQVRPFLRHTTF